MKKVLEWVKENRKQFKMADTASICITAAIRLYDNEYFSSSIIVYYKNRKALILDFMSDYIHVSIEVRKPQELIVPSEEFNPDNYDYIEVPINELTRK